MHDAQQLFDKLLSESGAKFDRYNAKKQKLYVFPNGKMYLDRNLSRQKQHLSIALMELKRAMRDAGYGAIVERVLEAARGHKHVGVLGEKLTAVLHPENVEAAPTPAPTPTPVVQLQRQKPIYSRLPQPDVDPDAVFDEPQRPREDRAEVLKARYAPRVVTAEKLDVIHGPVAEQMFADAKVAVEILRPQLGTQFILPPGMIRVEPVNPPAPPPPPQPQPRKHSASYYTKREARETTWTSSVRKLTPEEIKIANGILHHAGPKAYDRFVSDCMTGKRQPDSDYLPAAPQKENRTMSDQPKNYAANYNPTQMYRMMQIHLEERKQQLIDVGEQIKNLTLQLNEANEKKAKLEKYISNQEMALEAMKEASTDIAGLDEPAPTTRSHHAPHERRAETKPRVFGDVVQRWNRVEQIMSDGSKLKSAQIYDMYLPFEPNLTRGAFEQSLTKWVNTGKLVREKEGDGLANLYQLANAKGDAAPNQPFRRTGTEGHTRH